MNALTSLLDKIDPQNPSFPPTLLFNEGWLLRILLDWFSTHPVPDHPLNFADSATWFSEALLPSASLPRHRGDPLGESHTHADGVIGQIIVGGEGKADLALAPDATQFIVLEAKISSPLSSGTSNAPYYDQAARNVACMAEVLRRADRSPWDVDQIGFYVLAPEEQIKSGVFEKQMQRESIREKVEKRVSAYEGEKDAWFEVWFTPLIGLVDLGVLSWEAIITIVDEFDPKSSPSIVLYHGLCMSYR